MTATQSPKIKSIAWGRIEIPGVGEGKDFKLYPGGGRPWDWAETGTRHQPGIQVADIKELLENGATTIVLSRGYDNKLHIDPSVLKHLAEKNVSLHIGNTGEAATIYNNLAETAQVGGLFHSTC